MNRPHACLTTCLLTLTVGIAACSKEPAGTVTPPPVPRTTATWPEGDALRMVLPLRAGQSVPIEQRIYRDESIEWLRRGPDGRVEHWLQNADGTLRHRAADGTETPATRPAASTSAAAMPTLIDLLAPLAGVRVAQARDAGSGSNSSDNGGSPNSGTGAGSNSSDNGGTPNSGTGGGSNSSDNGGSPNSGIGGGSNSSGNGGSPNSGTGGGSNSSGNGGSPNSGASGGSNSSDNGGTPNSGTGGGSNSSGNGGSPNSGTGGGSNSSDNGGSPNSGTGDGSNSSGNGGTPNSGTGGGSNSSGNGGTPNSGTGGGSNSSGNGGSPNSGTGGGSNSSDNGGTPNSGTGDGSNSSGNGGTPNSGTGGGSNSSGNGGSPNSGTGGGSNSSGNDGSPNSGTGGGSNSSDNGGTPNSGTGAGSNANGGGAPVPPAAGGGSGMGDPHYVSADGVLVSTQKAGEFWAMDSARGLRLQTRQEPWHDSRQVAGISAIAAGVGTHRVGVYLLPQPHVLLDGQMLDVGTARFRQIDFAGGGAVGVWSKDGVPGEAAVVWPDGSHVLVHLRDGWIDFRYRIAGGADVTGQRGLLGSADGNADNDRTARDGRIAHGDDDLDAFLESWRIRADESLFDYADGSGTDSYQRLDFPQVVAAPDATALQAASARCRKAGVTDARLQEACAFDLAVTGNEALLASHRAAQRQLQSRPPAAARSMPAHPASGLVPDMGAAQPIEGDEWQHVTLDPGQMRTFAVDLAQNTQLVAHPEAMDCVDAWDGNGAGWQWFDAQGHARSAARMACADLDGDAVGPGRYYIVVVAARAGAPTAFSFRPYVVR